MLHDYSVIRYKTSLSFLKRMGTYDIERILFAFSPEATFSFINFEGPDYENDTVSYLLFNSMPQRILVSIGKNCDIHHALSELQSLNPHVSWECLFPSDDDIDYKNPQFQRVTLKLITRQMRVNEAGILSL